MQIAELSPTHEDYPSGYLSASRVNMYEKCPAQFLFCYYLEGYAPPGAAAVLGSSFHAGIEVNYRQKVETEEDMPVEDVCDAFSDDFNERRHGGRWFSDEKPGAFKDQGVGLIRAYQKNIAPIVMPESIERWLGIHFDNYDWSFRGRADILTKDGILIETKTTGRRPSQPMKPHVLQATAYSAGILANDGKIPKTRIDYIVKNKTPITVSHPLDVTDGHINFFLGQIARVAHAIENDIFFPVRSGTLCSHRWCGYASMCEKKYGGIVPER